MEIILRSVVIATIVLMIASAYVVRELDFPFFINVTYEAASLFTTWTCKLAAHVVFLQMESITLDWSYM